ncbi:PDK2_3_4 [Lepeophtheirus salmonis]|uniref:Protein-serine/threonine kinase n=1 Tax=Lepeophtheirus salmonis TaxID=72036 RepID=A0A7R8HA66_LEPSM|nr:PDK2_3_4 [Lepeophtheirus salmonis]CAF2960079.1 PDK2_3_4 [Lepeophtheirus salmonis]
MPQLQQLLNERKILSILDSFYFISTILILDYELCSTLRKFFASFIFSFPFLLTFHQSSISPISSSSLYGTKGATLFPPYKTNRQCTEHESLFVGKRTLSYSRSSTLSDVHIKNIEKYSRYRPTPLTIQRFLDFGRNFTPESSYKFLQLELPVRLAGILRNWHFYPLSYNLYLIVKKFILSMCPVWMTSSGLRNNLLKKIEDFTETLKQVYRRHADTVTTMAHAVLTVKESYLSSSAAVTKLPKFERNIQYFLDRLYMSRISTRMLINQHVLFCARDKNPISDTELVGTIDPCCNILEVLDQAYKNSRFLCEQYYMNAPEMQVHTQNILQPDQDGKIEIVYVPSHLYHILFELIKNAMRATVEHSEGNDTYDLPPLIATVVRNAVASQQPEMGTGVPLAGYGYGLPLSRLYARYFAGDLQIYSCDGYGTDALVYLQTESDLAKENLPIYHEAGSRKIYEAHLTPNDWTVERP